MTISLDKLETLAKAATPGPWYTDSTGRIVQTRHVTRDVWEIPRRDDDITFICAFNPQTALALLKVVDIARTIVAEFTCPNTSGSDFGGTITKAGNALRELDELP